MSNTAQPGNWNTNNAPLTVVAEADLAGLLAISFQTGTICTVWDPSGTADPAAFVWVKGSAASSVLGSIVSIPGVGAWWALGTDFEIVCKVTSGPDVAFVYNRGFTQVDRLGQGVYRLTAAPETVARLPDNSSFYVVTLVNEGGTNRQNFNLTTFDELGGGQIELRIFILSTLTDIDFMVSIRRVSATITPP